MTFSTTIQARFGDLDPAGIVYYPRLVNYLHVALEDFFAGHVGRRYADVFGEGLGLPAVRVDMEFLSPVRFGDSVDLSVAVEHVGRTSVRLRYEGRVADRRVFRAHNTLVAVSTSTFQPTPLPDWLRPRLLAALEPPTDAAT